MTKFYHNNIVWQFKIVQLNLSNSHHRTKIMETLHCCQEANGIFNRALHWAIMGYRNLNQGNQVSCYKPSVTEGKQNWHELYKRFCMLLVNFFLCFFFYIENISWTKNLSKHCIILFFVQLLKSLKENELEFLKTH